MTDSSIPTALNRGHIRAVIKTGAIHARHPHDPWPGVGVFAFTTTDHCRSDRIAGVRSRRPNTDDARVMSCQMGG